MFGIKLCPKCGKPMVSDGYVWETVNPLFGKPKKIKKKQWRCESCNYYENE